jgi:hypothetical protein
MQITLFGKSLTHIYLLSVEMTRDALFPSLRYGMTRVACCLLSVANQPWGTKCVVRRARRGKKKWECDLESRPHYDMEWIL